MSSTIQEIVAIIDRSGSMKGKEEDTIGGINSTIKILQESLNQNNQNNQTNDVINVSIKLFDHEEIMLIRSLNIMEVRPIERRQYVPRGHTALYDAIGNSLQYIMEKKLHNPSIFNKCLIYIATDGLENASKKYNSDSLKKLITSAQKSYNIELIYLGANQDAILEASKIGILPSSAMNYSETPENSQGAYRSVANAAIRQRSNIPIAFTQTERQESQQESQQEVCLTPAVMRHITEPPAIRRQ